MVLVIALMCSGVGGRLLSGLRIVVLDLPTRDFFAVVFFDVDFLVVAFFGVDFLAVDFFGEDFFVAPLVCFLTGFFLVAIFFSPFLFLGCRE
jgi:hypothetical protein